MGLSTTALQWRGPSSFWVGGLRRKRTAVSWWCQRFCQVSPQILWYSWVCSGREPAWGQGVGRDLQARWLLVGTQELVLPSLCYVMVGLLSCSNRAFLQWRQDFAPTPSHLGAAEGGAPRVGGSRVVLSCPLQIAQMPARAWVRGDCLNLAKAEDVYDEFRSSQARWHRTESCLSGWGQQPCPAPGVWVGVQGSWGPRRQSFSLVCLYLTARLKAPDNCGASKTWHLICLSVWVRMNGQIP